MTLQRAQIRDAIVQALISSNTMAGTNVYTPRNYPETTVQLPSITVTAPAETKESIGRTGPKFNSTAHIVVLGRLQGSTAMAAEAQLEQFAEEIETAVLGDIDVNTLIQQFKGVDTRAVVTAEGRSQIGEISVVFSVEFYEEFQVGIPQKLTITVGATFGQAGTLSAQVPLPPA